LESNPNDSTTSQSMDRSHHPAGHSPSDEKYKAQADDDTVNAVSEKYLEKPNLMRMRDAWPGRNSPVFCGSCLMGPDRGVWIITVSLISVPTGLFVFFKDASPSIAVSIIAVITWIFSIFCLCKATFTEPGIIPRNDVREEPLWKKEQPPKVLIGKSEMALKYCSTCHIWRPPRSKHCRDCDNCVEKFDHVRQHSLLPIIQFFLALSMGLQLRWQEKLPLFHRIHLCHNSSLYSCLLWFACCDYREIN
jgi:hypothetical protein